MDLGGRRLISDAATAAGAAHVRLSFSYLDDGDLDGFGSLLHDDVRVHLAGQPTTHGRDAALRLLSDLAGGEHVLDDIVAVGDQVAVSGRHVTESAGTVGFNAFFGLSAEALVLSVRRYHDPGVAS